MKKPLFVIFSLILTACGSNPASYLPSGTTPIINVESPLAERVNIEAKSDQLSVTNLTDVALNSVYKLFWYDLNGVTQPSAENWQNLWLEPHQSVNVPLNKPSEESANYRFYLRGNR